MTSKAFDNVVKLNDFVSVKDFGAVGDGVTNDAPAFQAAVNFAVAKYLAAGGANAKFSAPGILIPAGDYRLNSTITVERNIVFEGIGHANIIIGHTGTGFDLRGIPAANIFPRNKMVFRQLRFTTAPGVVCSIVIQNGRPDGGSPTYLYAQIDTEITSCAFDIILADIIFLNHRGFGVNFNSCMFTALAVSDSVIRMRQSNGDNPFWSYAFNFYSCDFTNVDQLNGTGGVAIKADAGDVKMFGGIVEGCQGDAIILGAAGGSITGFNCFSSFHGTYFETNTGDHIKSDRGGSLGFFSCKFVSGGVGNSFTFNAAVSASFYNCITPNNACTFNGGTSFLYQCSYMFQGNKPDINTRVYVMDYYAEPVPATAQHNIYKQLAVNSTSEGGGASLVLCSHYLPGGGASSTVAELFLIRHGVASNNFTALSLGKSAGGSNITNFTFSADANGYLQVTTDSTGFARYQVLATNIGTYLPT